MKTGLMAVVAAWALGMGVAHASDPPVVRAFTANVALDVGTGGQVTGVSLPAEVPAILSGPAQEAMKRWRFRPPVREGHPVTARTYANTSLQILRRPDGNYGLHVVFLKNGPKLTFAQAPRYPAEAIRNRNEGSLTMEATARPDGTLTDVRMVGHRFKRGNVSPFEHAVMEALAHCQVTPEQVDGKPVATRIRMPFSFTLHYVTRSEVLSARSARPAAAAATDPGAVMPPDQVVALDSPVQPLEGASRG